MKSHPVHIDQKLLYFHGKIIHHPTESQPVRCKNRSIPTKSQTVHHRTTASLEEIRVGSRKSILLPPYFLKRHRRRSQANGRPFHPHLRPCSSHHSRIDRSENGRTNKSTQRATYVVPEQRRRHCHGQIRSHYKWKRCGLPMD